MINRTQFIKFLENLDNEWGSIHFGNQLRYATKEEFQTEIQKTIAILKEYDEEWKKEQQSLPTLETFIEEQTKEKRGHYTFEIKIKNGKSYTLSDSEILSLFKNSRLMTEYVVISKELKETKQGWYQNEAQWSYPEFLCKIEIDSKGNYDNVRTEAN